MLHHRHWPFLASDLRYVLGFVCERPLFHNPNRRLAALEHHRFLFTAQIRAVQLP
nr:MAG TPA: hypothetical protein [Caudoviricetes sp.]